MGRRCSPSAPASSPATARTTPPDDAMRTERIEVGAGVALEVDVWDGGAGVPFLLSHGLASNRRLWAGTAARLLELGHPVVTVDLRGHGGSDKPDNGYDF